MPLLTQLLLLSQFSLYNAVALRELLRTISRLFYLHIPAEIRFP